MARHDVPRDAGQGRTRPLIVILDPDDEPNFDVTPARVPSGLPGAPDGAEITWFSNFEVQKKAGRPNTGRKVKYNIEMESVAGDLYYYDASSKTAIKLAKRSAGNDRIQADLSVDDPPIGHT